MLKQLIQLLKQKKIMSQALQRTDEALVKAETLTRAAIAALADRQAPSFDIYALDREINQAEVDIRRMILQHLSIDTTGNVPAALVITSTIIDIERIGDYAKNFYELSMRFPEGLTDNPHASDLRGFFDSIMAMFGETRAALQTDDAAAAAKVMAAHARLGRKCETLIDTVVQSSDITPRQAVLTSLSSRYVKRVSAHLSNLASGVVNAFDRVGFQPGTDPPEDADM